MKNNIFSVAGKNYQLLAPLFLRLIIGFGFMAHGWAKLSKGPAGFAKLLIYLHVPEPHTTAWLVIICEIVGGAMILIGLLTSIIAVPLVGTMMVAMFGIHIHYGFSAVKTVGLTANGPLFGPPGYEINLIYIAGLLALVTLGAGRFSIDAWLAKK